MLNIEKLGVAVLVWVGERKGWVRPGEERRGSYLGRRRQMGSVDVLRGSSG